MIRRMNSSISGTVKAGDGKVIICECLKWLFGLPDIPARRIATAAQELVSCIAAGSSRPKDQRVAAPATGRGALEALLQIINVLQVCSARLREHLCFDGIIAWRAAFPVSWSNITGPA
jgi:hypothetical protein